VSYAAENSSVFSFALKVVMVAALFVTGDREFRTAGAMILNAFTRNIISIYFYILIKYILIY